MKNVDCSQDRGISPALLCHSHSATLHISSQVRIFLKPLWHWNMTPFIRGDFLTRHDLVLPVADCPLLSLEGLNQDRKETYYPVDM